MLVGSQRELKLLVLETVSLEITQEKAVSPCFLHGVSAVGLAENSSLFPEVRL